MTRRQQIILNTSLLYLICVSALYFIAFKEEDLNIFPNGISSTKVFDDHKKNMNSKILAHATSNDRIDFRYKMDTTRGAFAGFDIVLYDTVLNNFSNYNAIEITYSTQNVAAFNISARTVENGITEVGNPRSRRYNYIYEKVKEESKQTTSSFSFSDFQTKDWWRKSWSKTGELSENPDWSKVQLMTVTHEVTKDKNLPSSITIHNLKLTKDNTFFFTLAAIVLGLFYAVMVVIYYRTKNKQIPEKVTISYKSLEQKTEDNQSWKQKVIYYIGSKYSDANLGLQDVADHVGKSDKLTSRFIQEEFSLTFKQYLNNIRLAEAKKFLKERNLSIKEIAFIVGYSSTNHFTRVFKQYEHITPSEFRQKEHERHLEPEGVF